MDGFNNCFCLGEIRRRRTKGISFHNPPLWIFAAFKIGENGVFRP